MLRLGVVEAESMLFRDFDDAPTCSALTRPGLRDRLSGVTRLFPGRLLSRLFSQAGGGRTRKTGILLGIYCDCR